MTHTKKLPPDPDFKNAQRADWADTALVKFQAATRGDTFNSVADLLCNLMHLCDRESERYGTFTDALRRARSDYRYETAEV